MRHLTERVNGEFRLLSLVFVCLLAGCAHQIANSEHYEVPQITVPVSQWPRGYDGDSQRLFTRLKDSGKVEDIKAWAIRLLQTHSTDRAIFHVPPTEWPDFITKLDPPLEPSMVLVISKDRVVVAWGGGFGWWGLHLSDHDMVNESSVIYAVECVPGVAVFHDIQ